MINVGLQICINNLNFGARSKGYSKILECVPVGRAPNVPLIVNLRDDGLFAFLWIGNSRSKSLDITETMQSADTHVSDINQ